MLSYTVEFFYVIIHRDHHYYSIPNTQTHMYRHTRACTRLVYPVSVLDYVIFQKTTKVSHYTTNGHVVY